MSAAHSTMYARLVRDTDDAVGALAYTLYKQHKGEYIRHVIETEGRPPTDDELRVFHEQSALDSQVAGYRHRAELQSNVLLQSTIDSYSTEIETSATNTVLARELVGVQVRIDKVIEKLSERRTLHGWIADVAGNLTVNVVTIALVGSIVLGYGFVSRLSTQTESAVGVRAWFDIPDTKRPRTDRGVYSAPDPVTLLYPDPAAAYMPRSRSN